MKHLMADCVYDLQGNETQRHALVAAAAGKPGRIGMDAGRRGNKTACVSKAHCAKSSRDNCKMEMHKVRSEHGCEAMDLSPLRHTLLEKLITLFVLTAAFFWRCGGIGPHAPLFLGSMLGVIGIALVITSGPEIRKLWQARPGKE